jgi:hypothetical protein
MRFRTLVRRLPLILAGLFVIIQAVPYGRNHQNPPVLVEPSWNSPETRDLAKRACFDCHSNETTWPWYSQIAPVSWLVQSDVDSGRRHLNFSEWNRPQRHRNDAADQIRKGEMPPWYFLPMHPEAHLSSAQKDQLLLGLASTLNPPQ